MSRSSHIVLLLARCLATVAVATVATATAQPFVQRVAPFTVERIDGGTYLNPFSGGMLSPRIGLVDADRDGRLDLFTLNPDNRLRLYRNERNLRFRRLFPSPYDRLPVRNWFRFVDIDGDGDDDLYTSSERLQILFYRNEGTQTSPSYSAVPDTLRGADGSPIYNDQITIPAFVDIDGDGDLDLFIGNSDGTITFYENRGSRTEPKFTFVTSTFQNIQVISPASAKERSKGGAIEHGASVQSFLDLDGDGDLDMLFGDYFTKKLLYFHNDGSRSAPRFSMNRLDTAFLPIGDEVESSQGFNQAEGGDLDNDGDSDVVISSLFPQATAQPLILYRNMGSATAPLMQRQSVDLADEIDLGTYAAPSPITDRDHHGLLVGSTDGTLNYFEIRTESGNTVWRFARRFVLPASVQQSVPASGDLDGDGVAEVVVGDYSGYLRLFKFNGNILTATPWQLDTVKFSQNSYPALADLDNDGDLDILVGGYNGRFAYFENVGSPAAPLFIRKTPPKPFDTLDIGGYSSPSFFDLNGDGLPDAIVGGRPGSSVDPGQPHRVQFFLNMGGTFAKSDLYPDITGVQGPAPVMLSLAEGRFLFVGDDAGGIIAFADSSTATSGVAEPLTESRASISLALSVIGTSDRTITLRWGGASASLSFLLFDPLGRQVMRGPLPDHAGTTRIDLTGLASGVYFYQVTGGDRDWSGKLILLR